MSARHIMLTTTLLAISCVGGGGGNKDLPEADVPAPDVPDFAEVPDLPAEDVIEAITPPVPWGPENRGWIVMRGIVHLHSVYSHDGCAPDGWEGTGPIDLQCLQELRDAPCLTGTDFIMQTDHPSHVRDVPFEDALHFDPAKGDTLAKDAKGRPFANRVACPDKKGRAWFFAGCEGSKNMPIGLSGPVPEEVFGTNYGDKEPLETAKAAVAKAREMGGFAFTVHTEEGTISADRIVALGLDGMEVYNLHANLMAALGDFNTIASVDRFMGDPAKAADPNLSLLTFLSPLPVSVEKFDKALAKIRMAGVVATDIHRNVEIPPLCEGGINGNALCENLSVDYPNFVNFLIKGGPLPLSDGDRMDSYARALRWFANRAYVKNDDPEEIRQAVGHARGFAAFDAFGPPQDFDFFAVTKKGAVVEMGGEVEAKDGVTLYVRKPVAVAPLWGIPGVTEWSAADVNVRVLGIPGMDVTTNAPALEVTDPAPGAYRVEVSIRPLHLKPALKGVESLAEKTYPYVYSNAIHVK